MDMETEYDSKPHPPETGIELVWDLNKIWDGDRDSMMVHHPL